MATPTPDGGTCAAAPSAHSVFLSYSRSDRKGALAVVRLLEGAGYDVWWDGLLEGGERFSHTTEAALDHARAVVVLWSKTSVCSHWVHDEATRGRETGRLVPLSLDGSLPPLGFGQFQSIDVSHALGKPHSEPVQKLLRAVAALHEGAAPAPRASRRVAAPVTRRKILLASGAVAATAAGGFALWKARGLFAHAPDQRSVAVLPFANLSGDPAQRYFSDGLTSEIRTQLARNGQLQVAGQTSSEKAGGERDDARAIAQALGVAFVLDGNVQKAGGKVKIAAELTDGASGLSRWADSYERPLADIFAVQSEIGAAVAGALSAAIGGRAQGAGRTPVGGTGNVSAFDAYLHGRALYEAGIDEASDRRALAYFDEAITLDARYAAAYAARARALVVIGNLYAAHDERIQAYDAAVAAATDATRLAPDFAEGFSALGFALASGKLDMRGARAPFDRSHALAPGDADVLSRYATFRSNLRDHLQAGQVIARSSALDPLNARTFRSSGDIAYNGGDLPAAMAAYRKAITLNPTLAGVNASLGFAQMLAGQDEAARTSFSAEKSAVRRLPGLAILARRAGDRAAADAALATLVAEYGDKSHYQYAQIHAQWGNREQALLALRKAWALRDGGMMLMYADPLLAPLRDTDGYRALARSVGFIP